MLNDINTTLQYAITLTCAEEVHSNVHKLNFHLMTTTCTCFRYIF